MLQLFIGLALLFFAGYYFYLLLLAKFRDSAKGVVYETYAEKKNLSLSYAASIIQNPIGVKC